MVALPELTDLIDATAFNARSDDPLMRLIAAARMRDDLHVLAEGVLDHFVEEARRAGCSWSDVGGALGVTKQAAQQRHAATDSIARRLLSRVSARGHPHADGALSGGLYGRFTSRAREIVVVAEQEASALGHDYIGTEHVLLGLLRKEDGVAAKALRSLKVSLDDVRRDVVQIVGSNDTCGPGRVAFTPRAKKALDLSVQESAKLNHNYVGTEHLLLGLARDRHSLAMKILQQHDVTAADVRTALDNLLNGSAEPARRAG